MEKNDDVKMEIEGSIYATVKTNADDQPDEITAIDGNATISDGDENKLFEECGIVISDCGGCCKKNSVSNLACYCGLGQAKWETSEEKIEKSLQKKLNKINKEKTEKNTATVPLGLVNLGATCYVNSVLQIWFHNTSIRRAFYNIKLDPSSNLSPLHNIMRKIFAQLQGSQLPLVDPTELIDLLRIERNIQQDALEFSKLVINKFQLQQEFKTFLDEELIGSYVYKIKCLSCLHENSRQTEFSELDLHPTLDIPDLQGLIRDYLKEEDMSGENQYYCCNCQQHSDAVRYMELKRLPNTLTFHLLRFLYDTQNKQRRKIHYSVAFPNRIDMKQFMAAPSSGDDVTTTTTEYELTAIMLHRGQTASCGHFIVHNRDRHRGGCWYVLNDDNVSKLSARHGPGESSKESSDDLDWTIHQNGEGTTSPAAKKRRKQRGSDVKVSSSSSSNSNNEYNSDDAYMLMYTRVDRLHGDEPAIPDDVMRFVETSNQAYFREEEERKEKGKQEAQDDYLRKMTRVKLLEDLAETTPSSGQPFNNWVPTALVKQFFQTKKPNSESSGGAGFDSLLCPHQKVPPVNMTSFKRMTSQAADLIYADQPASTLRLRSDRDDVICTECCQQFYKISSLKRELEEDGKKVNKMIGKAPSSGGDGYLIGKKSLKKWRQNALKNLESEEKNETTKMTSLNGDIICCHENLKFERSGLYSEIPSECWTVIRKYFRKCYEFPAREQRACDECLKNKENQQSLDAMVKERAVEQKQALKNLIGGRARPDQFFLSQPNRHHCQSKFFIVPKRFITQLRRFVGQPSRFTSTFDVANNSPGFAVDNSVFLCKHQRFIYDPVALIRGEDVLKDGEAPGCCLLWPKEWRFIKENYKFDHELYVQKRAFQCQVRVEVLPNLADFCSDTTKIPPPPPVQPPPPGRADNDEVRRSPPVCPTCLADLSHEIISRHLVYKDEKILVRLSPNKPEEIVMSLQSAFDDLPIFNSITGAGATTTKKRRKTRLARGEKYIQGVSSSQTLKEIKIEIMKLFSIPPYDQHLFLNGMYMLNEDGATLQSLGVARDSFILLAEDRLPDELGATDDVEKMVSVATEASIQSIVAEDRQAGFEGTVLMESVSRPDAAV